MLAIAILAVFWPALKTNRAALWALGLFVLIGAGMRVIKGRHFLSDTLLAVLFMALLALVLFHLLRIREARRHVTGANLRHDLRAIMTYVRARLPADLWLLAESLWALIRTVPEAFGALRKPPGGWSNLSPSACLPAWRQARGTVPRGNREAA